MRDEEVLDAVVVGGGPSGLFAMWRLATGGARVALLEAGQDMRASLCSKVSARMAGRSVREAEKFRLQCHRCDCLTGIGGAAFHFDTNLGYVSGLSRSKLEADAQGRVRTYSGLERALGSFERAADAVADVYDHLVAFGVDMGTDAPATTTSAAPPAGFALADAAPSKAITVDEAIGMLDALVAQATAAGAVVHLGTRALTVERRADGVWEVRTPTGVVRARHVVVGVGKLGLPWVESVLAANHVVATSAPRVDVGVRLELPAEIAEPLTAPCQNPKLTFLNAAAEPVRTFCVCERGRIMQYAFEGAVVLDGQHCVTTPTSRTNIGVVTTVDVPAGVGGTDHAREFARRITAAGQGLPVVQPLLELLRRGRLAERPGTSLVRATWGDLAPLLGRDRVADVEEMADRLEEVAPGVVGPDTVVAAPVVERVFPSIELDGDMQSSAPGLFFVGDSSSKIIGVTYGAATGIVAADAVLRKGPTS
ncbi:FAD-dependent oxidoreductase [Cellulomonas phragmiteti]|uniref:FAD dependent oxidoreductase domain-containing protein n=1 Tax=Cellulomonas phragmiteti TaxID=478780 RepID=A0ABQ4DR93_9CELL|nr:FAD-dependent oxidoreductase [Cellulomonas phragmiteti]GIG41863.1 hypothetical protein Cph01nite_36250 [Cellulomonas phragmiteti]